MENPFFYAKILLFGEYGIIENAKGLSIPYMAYKGRFEYSSLVNDFDQKSNFSLKKYLDFLKKQVFSEDFALDFHLFKKDLEQGLFFNSDIPQGYGVGSSGALVAAIFERYAISKKEDLGALKNFLGQMESFFHGKSSGIDPLICYLKSPIFIENKQYHRIELPQRKGKGSVFLIDSGMIGETGPMVQIFFEKMKNDAFRETLKNDFIRYNDLCIHSFLNNDNELFFSALKSLSEWTYTHLAPMIPEHILPIWKKGLETDDYYLKLCGSGGGGYVLGFVKGKKNMKEYKKVLDF